MRNFILCTFFLLLIRNSSAQSAAIDSLKKVVESSIPDTLKLSALEELRIVLTNQSEQIFYLNKQLALAEKLKKYEMTAKLLGDLGWFKYTTEDFQGADSCYHQSIAICRKYNYQEEEGADYTCLMMLYWWQGKTKEGVSYFEKAETILQKINAYKKLSSLYLNASELYKNIQLPNKSLLYAEKSFEFANKTSDTSCIIQSAAFLGDAYRISGNDKKALSTLNLALILAKKRGDEYNEGDINNFLCTYYYEKKDYSKALAFCNSALKLYTKLDLHDRVLNALGSLSDIYFFQKDFVNAKKTLLQKKALIRSGSAMEDRYLYTALANIDLINKDLPSWQKNIAVADSLEDLYTSAEVKKGVLEIDTKYQTTLKEKQILLLKQQKNIQQIFIASLLAGLIALIAIGFFVYRYINQKKKIAEQENIQLKQEKQLMAMDSILKVQEAERTRMAKDLHDGLGGMLSGIKLNLSSMKGNVIIQEKDANLFARSINQLDNAIAEMRRVAHNMMPEALLKFGLNEAIIDYCDGINESNTVKMKFTHIGLQQPLEKSTEVILYRIVQELTNNAIKHAEAKNIFIQLTRHERGTTLTVEDDGKGFNAKQQDNFKGAGLQNVQSRVDYLKGTFDIESEAGKGTSVTIEIPS